MVIDCRFVFCIAVLMGIDCCFVFCIAVLMGTLTAVLYFVLLC